MASGAANVIIYGASSTGNDTYVITPNPAIAGYAAGQVFEILVDVGNTGTASVNSSAKGAKTIKKLTAAGKAVLDTGDMLAGGNYILVYDGTDMILQNPTSILTSIFTARGMFIRSSAANTPEAVALGTSRKALISDGTDIVWGYPASAQYVASDNAILTANTERTTSSTSYVAIKSFVVKHPGTVRVACQIKSSGGNFARLSLDGVNTVYATNETSYQNVSFDMPVVPFVTKNILLKSDGGIAVYIRNLEIHGDISSSAYDNSIVD